MEQICAKYMTEDRKKREGDIGERVSKYLGNETDMKSVNVYESTNNTDHGARETSFAVCGPHPEARESWKDAAANSDRWVSSTDLALQFLKDLLSDRPLRK